MITIPEEIKALLQSGNALKNVRIHFPNGERADITNDYHLLEGTFKFTEQICSQNTLKFGLCEANIIEFQCIDIENIEGCEIAVYHEIDISSQAEEFIAEHGMASDDVAFPYYRIPYGVFIVKKCPRTSDMNIRSVAAYTKEVDWDLYNNPLDKEKHKGKYLCEENSPYNFNVMAQMYSNVLRDYQEGYFAEKTEVELPNIYAMTGVMTLNSSVTVSNSTGTDSSPKYSFIIKGWGNYLTITDDNADALYELIYSNLAEDDARIQRVIDKIMEYANNPQYSFELDTLEQSIAKFKSAMINVTYYGKRFGSDTPENSNIVAFTELNNHHYIYPYMGYSKTELSKLNYVGAIRCTWTVEFTLIEYHYDRNDEFVQTIIYESDAQLRPASDFKVNIINSFPHIYMQESREKFRANGKTMYALTDSKIELRNTYAAMLELCGMFGRYNRQGCFEFFTIGDNFGLYPSENLYPSEDLYPKEPSAGSVYRTHYISARYEDNYTKPYGKIDVTYQNTDGELVYAYYPLVDEEAEDYNADNYQTYSLTSNYLIQNSMFSAETIEQILSNVAENIKSAQYMPAEIKLIGRPDIEAGDVIHVITNEGGFETFVLRRTLTGEQMLIDNFESRG